MANFTIVDKGVSGVPECWVTGAPVGNPYRAVMFHRWIDISDPLGPIYLCEPVCKELGAAFGMVEAEHFDRLASAAADTDRELEVADETIARLEAECADLRKVVERYYTPAVPEKPKAVKK